MGDLGHVYRGFERLLGVKAVAHLAADLKRPALQTATPSHLDVRLTFSPAFKSLGLPATGL